METFENSRQTLSETALLTFKPNTTLQYPMTTSALNPFQNPRNPFYISQMPIPGVKECSVGGCGKGRGQNNTDKGLSSTWPLSLPAARDENCWSPVCCFNPPVFTTTTQPTPHFYHGADAV